MPGPLSALGGVPGLGAWPLPTALTCGPSCPRPGGIPLVAVVPTAQSPATGSIWGQLFPSTRDPVSPRGSGLGVPGGSAGWATQSALCSGSCLGPAAPGCAPVVRAPGLPATCAGHSWASAHTHRLPRRAPASQQHMQRGTGTPRGAGGRWVEQAGRGGTGPSPGGTGPHRGADPTRLSMPTSSSAVGALCSATSPGPAAPGLDPARGPSRAGRS